MSGDSKVTKAFTIRLEKPLASVKLLGTATTQPAQAQSQQLPTGPSGPDEQLRQAEQNITRACRALQDAAKKVTDFQENIFRQARAQIAKLSVEIAAKILRREIQKQNYDIEAMVSQALENSPTCEGVVVHLNPDDLACVQKTIKPGSDAGPDSASEGPGKWSPLENVNLVADPNIKPAECLLETPQGMIESFIDAQLQQIAEVLKNAG